MTEEDYGKINLAEYFVRREDLINATTTNDGLMSKEDKIKLNSVNARIDWTSIDNVPATFAPSSHTHVKVDITDFNHSHGDIDENGVISNGNNGDILILGVGNRITSSASIDAGKIQNLKTINNESIVGTGNITITGGSGSNITVDSALDGTSSNPVENQVIKNALDGKEDANSKKNSIPTDVIGPNENTQYPTIQAIRNYAQPKGNYLTEHQSLKTINNESIVGTGNITITGGSNITVDSALSSISENPVQNQVIYSALENKANNTVATSSANGLMSTTDKNKLDGMTTVSFTINYTDGTSETLTLFKQTNGS